MIEIVAFLILLLGAIMGICAIDIMLAMGAHRQDESKPKSKPRCVTDYEVDLLIDKVLAGESFKDAIEEIFNK